MSLITGLGDEIIVVLAIFTATLLLSLLWLSTRVNERPPVRAFLFRTTVTSSAHPPSTETNSSDPLTEPGASTVAESENNPEVPEESAAEQPDGSPADDAVKIRLRFEDETTLEVETRLSESLSGIRNRLLGNRLNLTPQDGVRLVFNGRILHRDPQILSDIGVYNGCVVHCLVRRGGAGTGPDGNHTSNRANEDDINFGLGGGDLDLSSMCYPLLGTFLFILWWCQVVYAHYFTFLTTAVLISMTTLYFAMVSNAYFYD